MRESRSLAGRWGLRLDPHGTLTSQEVAAERVVTVPLPWQTEQPELTQYSGFGWYVRTFDVPAEWLSGEVLLHFGAVDYWCEVFVNDVRVGAHEGGYTPFSFAVRHALRTGENRLTVRVYDAVQTGHVLPRWWQMPAPEQPSPPFNPITIPHGKQTWYVDVSGIWQDVTLTPVPASYLTYAHVTAALDGTVAVRVGVAQPQPGTLRVRVEGASAETALSDDGEQALRLRIERPRLWTMDTPHLYTATVTLETAAGLDRLAVRFGFRQLEARDGQLFLNGEPIYLLSALDQDIYPDTIYTPPSTDFLRDQFVKAKELGLNSLRCHIKPPDPRYLDLADEMGLLIWAEIPSWRTWHVKTTVHPAALHMDEAVKARVRQTLRELVQRDYNHPSLMIWTLVNEDWGTALQMSAADRTFVRELYDLCRQLDPTRLIVDNSPCPAAWGFSPHVRTDINDFHLYSNIPDHASSFDQFIAQFALSPAWLFSSYGDSERRGDEPMVLSEFGNWGMPSLRHIGSEAHDGEPAWGDLGPWWNPYDGEPGYPQGVLKRFHAYGLDDIWGDYETFAAATQRHQFNALAYQIQAMRARRGIVGYVITEFTDLYWESNGLLDFARQPKVFHGQFRQINAEDVVIVQTSQGAIWSDEMLGLGLVVSHFSGRSWQDARVTLMLDDTTLQAQAVPELPRGSVQALGGTRVSLPQADAAAYVRVRARLENDAECLAESESPVFVLPASARKARYAGAVRLALATDSTFAQHSEPAALTTHSEMAQADVPEEASAAASSGMPTARLLRQLGYQITTRPTDLIIADTVTDDVLERVRGGARLLLATSSANPFFWAHGRGGAYGGGWITTFSWLRPGVYDRLETVQNPLSLEFLHVMPSAALLAVPMDNPAYHADILAGQVGGWIRHPAAHTVQFRLGEGIVIVTTYSLLKMLDTSAMAVAMLHDLVDYLMSNACQPTLRLEVGLTQPAPERV